MTELTGLKLDGGKNPLALLPVEALEEVGWIIEHGAEKYGVHNWRGGFEYLRISSAALRHIFAFLKGEDYDPDTGRYHIAHACCCLLFLLTFLLTKTGADDRFRYPK